MWLSSGVVLEGTVAVTNGSKEPKVLPKGVYKDTTVDLTGEWVGGWGVKASSKQRASMMSRSCVIHPP